MTNLGRPGVFIQESAMAQAVDVAQGSDALGAFIGKLGQGPTEPVLVSSWSDFVKNFGNVSATYPTTFAAYQFFSNGGRSAYVVRVVGANSDAASATLVDRQGTPDDTLLVSASSAGAWANDSGLSIEIVASSADSFGIRVYGKPVSVGADSRSNLLEQFGDLSMDVDDPRYAPDLVNTLSRYIRLTDLGSSATTAANKRPAISNDLVTLSGGSNGDAPARVDYSDAMAKLDNIETPLLLNVPDAAFIYTTAGSYSDRTLAVNISADLVSYADAGSGFAIIDTPAGLTAAEAAIWSADVIAATGNASAGAQAACYYPWVQVSDQLRQAPGVVRLLPPGGAVIGQYQATDTAHGVFKTPAGYGTRINTAIGLEKRLTNAELDDLNVADVPVNALRVIPGSGVAIMGGRTMLNIPGYRYVNMRRSLIFLKKELSDRSAFAVFQNNDSRLWDSIVSALGSFLASYWAQGGLRGSTPDQAFFVKCDETTITEADIASGRVNIEVGVALEYPAEYVLITIGQVTGNASVTQG